MSVESTLASGRRAAERLMQSVCEITRLQEVTLDTASLTLSDTDPSDDLIYQGPCRIRDMSSRVQVRDREGQTIAAQQSVLWLPITAGEVLTGDRVEILDGGPNPRLTGNRYRIEGLSAETHATSNRYLIESA